MFGLLPLANFLMVFVFGGTALGLRTGTSLFLKEFIKFPETGSCINGSFLLISNTGIKS